MAKNLVIVESPAKAKTIEKFLGSDFEVRASMGHIIDLPTKGLGVDTRNDFAPNYVVIEKKDRLVSELKAASKKADTVYLAPDPDREGEFIAWSLKYILGLRHPRRAVFNEITKRAVQDAVAHPRDIDENLFNAQQARRVLDRLVGYKISPLLWRRVQKGTSAGRVQSVALRLICDREAEIRAFVPEEYWTITATLAKQGQQQTFEAALIGRRGSPEVADEPRDGDDAEPQAAAEPKSATDGKSAQDEHARIRIHSGEEAHAILAELEGAAYSVVTVRQRDVRRQPYLPYTTSTLQQDASVRLRFKPKRTMSLAQDLYEGIELGERGHQGLITYMRTDSTRVSAEAQVAVKDYIADTFSKQHVGPGRTAKAKAGVQDAHEAIRPTDVALTPESVRSHLTPDQFRLYQLVWRRFVASFMAPAVFDTVRADIAASSFIFRATGSTLKFDGFYRVWPREDDGDTLPPLQANEPLDQRKISPEQHFTQPPPRFTEASLIKDLEEKGIGRPSTYVPIVSTIQERNYVEQVERRFVPTWLGETVNELMIKHFPDIVDMGFTADMEQRLDAVEQGERGWTAFLQDFYGALKEQLGRAESEMDKVQKPVEELDEACPQCGRTLVIRTGRFGRFISCSGFPECEYRRSMVVKTGALCPECGGDLLERKTRKAGKTFYGCANYPTCTFATWDRPLTVPCPECGGLLTQANNKSEAACEKCGALIAGASEGTPLVVGHRDPAARQQRTTRRRSTTAASADGTATTGARKRTTGTRTTAARAAPTRKSASARTGATRAKSGTKSGTKSVTKSASKSGTKAGTTAARRASTTRTSARTSSATGTSRTRRATTDVASVS